MTLVIGRMPDKQGLVSILVSSTFSGNREKSEYPKWTGIPLSMGQGKFPG